jgi:MFS family permease
VAAFVIGAATTLPLGARLSCRFGPRLILLVGVGTFGVASIVAAASEAIPVLVAARAVQGTGVALVEPAVRAVVQGAFTDDDTTRAQQAQGVAALLAAALGPLLPAALATVVSWRAQFWLGAVLSAAILAAAYRRVPTLAARGSTVWGLGPDLLVTAAGVAAAVALFFALIEGPRLGWTSPYALGSVTIAVLVLAIAVPLELRRRDPLVRLALLRRRRFRTGNVARAITEFMSLGVFFPLSGFLQEQLGHSPVVAGLLLMPIILGALLTAPYAEVRAGHVDARWFLVPGFLCSAAGIFWLAHLTSTTPWWFVLAPLALAGAGIGALESPADRVITDDTPTTATEPGWRLSRTVYYWGIGGGVAVVSAAWQVAGTSTPAGVNSALDVCAVAALVGAGVAATLPARQPT